MVQAFDRLVAGRHGLERRVELSEVTCLDQQFELLAAAQAELAEAVCFGSSRSPIMPLRTRADLHGVAAPWNGRPTQAEVAKRFVQPAIASAMNLRALHAALCRVNEGLALEAFLDALQFNFQRIEALRLFGA